MGYLDRVRMLGRRAFAMEPAAFRELVAARCVHGGGACQGRCSAAEPEQRECQVAADRRCADAAAKAGSSKRPPVATDATLTALEVKFAEQLHVDPEHTRLMKADPSGKLLDEHLSREHKP